MNSITILSDVPLDFNSIHQDVLTLCPKTAYEGSVMTNGRSFKKWYFYNLPDQASEIFGKEDLENLPTKSMVCYELSFRSDKCPFPILQAIRKNAPSVYVYDDILDKFFKIEDYICLLGA